MWNQCRVVLLGFSQAESPICWKSYATKTCNSPQCCSALTTITTNQKQPSPFSSQGQGWLLRHQPRSIKCWGMRLSHTEPNTCHDKKGKPAFQSRHWRVGPAQNAWKHCETLITDENDNGVKHKTMCLLQRVQAWNAVSLHSLTPMGISKLHSMNDFAEWPCLILAPFLAFCTWGASQSANTLTMCWTSISCLHK